MFVVSGISTWLVVMLLTRYLDVTTPYTVYLPKWKRLADEDRRHKLVAKMREEHGILSLFNSLPNSGDSRSLKWTLFVATVFAEFVSVAMVMGGTGDEEFEGEANEGDAILGDPRGYQMTRDEIKPDHIGGCACNAICFVMEAMRRCQMTSPI